MQVQSSGGQFPGLYHLLNPLWSNIAVAYIWLPLILVIWIFLHKILVSWWKLYQLIELNTSYYYWYWILIIISLKLTIEITKRGIFCKSIIWKSLQKIFWWIWNSAIESQISESYDFFLTTDISQYNDQFHNWR